MGLFYLEEPYDEDKQTALTALEAAEVNMKLFLEHEQDYRYLISDFALPQLQKAIKRIKED